MAVLNQQILQPYFDHLRFEKRYSAHTLLSYSNDLSGFIDFLEITYGPLEISSIDHIHVRSWLAQLKEGGMNARTINRKLSALRSFFKFMIKTGVVSDSPMTKVTALKIPGRLPVFIKEKEATQLVQSLETGTEDWRSLNAALMITIFYTTGMRLSELINLKEKQVDLGRRQLKVLGKGNKERVLPVSEELVLMIRNYIREKESKFDRKETAKDPDPVLLVTEKGKKLYPKYAWLLVNDYLGRVSTLEKRSPHVLRHSFATHLMNNGANLNAVKELLGHSSLAATQVYTHNTIEKLRDIHKKAHPRG